MHISHLCNIYTDYRARNFFSPFVQISFHLQAKKSLSIAFNECRKYFCPKESYLDKKRKCGRDALLGTHLECTISFARFLSFKRFLGKMCKTCNVFLLPITFSTIYRNLIRIIDIFIFKRKTLHSQAVYNRIGIPGYSF